MKIFTRLKKPTIENVAFLKANPIFAKNFIKYKIDNMMIKDNLLNLLTVINDHTNIKQNHLYNNCLNTTKGIQVDVVYSYHKIDFVDKYCPCYYYHFFPKNYLYRDFPDNNLNFSLSHKVSPNAKVDQKFLKPTAENNEIINHLRKFCSKIISKDCRNSEIKGLYIYGPPNSGKTYIMNGLANWLAKQNFKIVFLNSLSLANDLKSSYSKTNSYNAEPDKKSLLKLVKIADILFIDDLGNEDQKSQWWRDQILFNVLDYRLKSNKITFIGSNFSLEQLKKYYTFNNSYADNIKVMRLFERIQNLCYPKLLAKSYSK